MKITFLASENKDFENILHYHQDIQFNLMTGFTDIAISDLSFLCFDLLEQGFDEIELYYMGEFYKLNLGRNAWTEKELRKEHNLLKLVRNYILNK